MQAMQCNCGGAVNRMIDVGRNVCKNCLFLNTLTLTAIAQRPRALIGVSVCLLDAAAAAAAATAFAVFAVAL